MSRGDYSNGVFDLHVSFSSETTPRLIDEWRQSWSHASELLYNATHGQMRLGTISYCLSASCPFADAWLLGQKGRSCSYQNITSGSGQMSLMHQCRKRPYVILHEFGHYGLFLKDEYDEYGHGKCIPDQYAVEARACVMEWGWSMGDRITDFKTHTIKPGSIYEFCSHEICTKYDPDKLADYQSCWDRIVRNYPDLTVPDTSKPFDPGTATNAAVSWEAIDWIEAHCAMNPLIYRDDSVKQDIETGRLNAVTDEAQKNLAGYCQFERASLETIEQQRDVAVCGTTLVLPVTGSIDVDAWKTQVQDARVRVFPVAVADTDFGSDEKTAATWRDLDELSRETNGRLKIFSDSSNLGLRVQSYMAELAAEMDPDAGICFLGELVFPSRPAQARQSCLVPVEEFSKSISFVLSVDGEMVPEFVAVAPNGTRYRYSPPLDGGGQRVHRMTIDSPVAGDWMVDLGRKNEGKTRHARFMAISANDHVHAVFDAQVEDDGTIALSARGFHHRFVLTSLHVEARTLGANPQRFNLADTVQTGCASGGVCSVGQDERIYSDAWYSAELPRGTKISDVMISVTNYGKAYSPYWSKKEPRPRVPGFFRTQRLMVPPVAEKPDKADAS